MMKSDITLDMWESKRAVITKLYMEEEWPLKHVIKVIQTENFQPSEGQLRARLKKWHVTKPFRKKYCSGKGAPTDFDEHVKPPASLGLTRESGTEPTSTSPTPKGLSSMTSTSQNDIQTPSGPVEFPGTPYHQLDSLTSAIDDHLLACCLLPGPGENPPTFTTVSNLHAGDNSMDTSNVPNFGQVVIPNDLLCPTAKVIEEQHGNRGDGGLSAMPCSCASPDDENMWNIIPGVSTFNNQSAATTLSPVNPATQEGTGCCSNYGTETSLLSYATPFEQYLTGLALCKDAIPRLTQRDRCRLRFHVGRRTGRREPTNFTAETCTAHFSLLSESYSPSREALNPSLACFECSAI